MTRLAVVLFNLGGPDSPEAVRPFLFNLFADPAIIQLPAIARLPLAAAIASGRARMARSNYQLIGGASPLLRETEGQARALETELRERAGDRLESKVFITMRYWRPRADEAARAVAAFSPDEIVLLPLYPQYSTTTTASSLRDWARAYEGPGRCRVLRVHVASDSASRDRLASRALCRSFQACGSGRKASDAVTTESASSVVSF